MEWNYTHYFHVLLPLYRIIERNVPLMTALTLFSVHSDVSHKHGENVQEFGDNRRQDDPDEELTNVSQVHKHEVGDKNEENVKGFDKEHKHENIKEITKVPEDDWDQRICCTKHNKLCCKNKILLKGKEQKKHADRKNKNAKDSEPVRYSTGSEVVEETKQHGNGKYKIIS